MRRLCVACVALALWGCGQSAPPESEQHARNSDAHLAAEQRLFSDPSKAAPELIKRINASVKMRDGLLLIETPLMLGDLSVLSPNSTWVVTCGAGIKVIFGSSITDDSDGIRNDVEFYLATVPIRQTNCEALAPLVGKRILAIAAGTP
jgi:hypothetical protein